MNNYFLEHLRDLYREHVARATDSYMREVSRQLVSVIDQVSRAKDTLRQQARDLTKKVGYCFLIDLEDINARYSNLEIPARFYQELEIIRMALKQEFPGMDITVTTTPNTVMYTVSAEL